MATEMLITTSEDEDTFDSSTESHSTGFTPHADLTVLMQKAAREGGAYLTQYEARCAEYAKQMANIASTIDEQNLTVQENSKTGAVRFRHYGLDEHGVEWTFTVTTTPLPRVLAAGQDASKTPDINISTSELSKGGATVFSTAVKSMTYTTATWMVSSVIASIVCRCIVRQAKRTALMTLKRADPDLLFEVGEKNFKKIMEDEVKVMSRRATKKAVRTIAKLSRGANEIMLAVFVASLVLAFLSKTTVWQVSILNKSDKDVHWTHHMNHGQLKDGPVVNKETGELYPWVPKSHVPDYDPDWGPPPDPSYYRLVLTFVNEGALIGVFGELMLRCQDLVVDGNGMPIVTGAPQYTLAFGMPYDGTNKVSISSATLTPRFLSDLHWELVDEPNNLRFTWCLSAEHHEQKVATINDGKKGWNYSSVVTVENIREVTHA